MTSTANLTFYNFTSFEGEWCVDRYYRGFGDWQSILWHHFINIV